MATKKTKPGVDKKTTTTTAKSRATTKTTKSTAEAKKQPRKNAQEIAKKKSPKKPANYASPPPDMDERLAAFGKGVIERALAFPEAFEDNPWGERVAKVKGKVFVFSSFYNGGFGFSVKLPVSGTAVLDLPFSQPTGYGLGKAGWVSCRFLDGEQLPPLDLVQDWIEESYRAVAPKTLSARLR